MNPASLSALFAAIPGFQKLSNEIKSCTTLSEYVSENNKSKRTDIMTLNGVLEMYETIAPIAVCLYGWSEEEVFLSLQRLVLKGVRNINVVRILSDNEMIFYGCSLLFLQIIRISFK